MALRYTLKFINLPKNQDENPIIDSLSSYVDSRAIAAGLIVEDASPFDMGLSTFCKIQLADTTSFISHNLAFNYCKVSYQQTGQVVPTEFFYWVKKNIRLANNVIRFDMEMDTLNTFKTGIERACTSDKNDVARCHINRFYKYNGLLYPNDIDIINENITLPMFYDQIRTINTENWNRPCYFVITSQICSKIVSITNASGQEFPRYKIDKESLTFGILTDVECTCNVPSDVEYWRQYEQGDPPPLKEFTAHLIEHTVKPISDFDRGIEKLIALKELPYPPYYNLRLVYDAQTTKYSIDGYSQTDRIMTNLVINENDHTITLKEAIDMALHGTYLGFDVGNDNITFDSYTLAYQDIPFSYTSISIDTQLGFGTVLDPKLYSSQFFAREFFYYNDSYTIKYENIHLVTNTRIKINYKVSNNISGDVLFEFTPTTYWKHQESNVEGKLLSKFTPELNLSSSNYINYMRTGWNWDTAKASAAFGNRITMGGYRIVTDLLKQELSLATGESDAGEFGTAMLDSTIQYGGTILSGYLSHSQQMKSLFAKRSQLAMKQLSINDNKDSDLMKQMVSNKLHYIDASVNDVDKASLNRYFHYYGYARNMKMAFPYDTRYWFNYCEGDIHLEQNIPEYAVSDVKARFKAGVTFYHYHNHYDWEQERENWEVSLL